MKGLDEIIPLRINIPIFHHSLAQTWHAGPAFHGHHFGNPTATGKFSTQLAPGQAIIPCARQKLRPYKIPLIPISCRISETLGGAIKMANTLTNQKGIFIYFFGFSFFSGVCLLCS